VSEAKAANPPLAVGAASLLAVAALLSIFFTKLALAVGFFSFLAAIVLPKMAGAAARRSVIGLIIVAAVASIIGFGRFAVLEAVPGMIQGGRARTAQHAVSRLREILVAEDALRKLGKVDPDHDGIGSAALLGELSGALPLRGGPRLEPPILSPRHFAQIDDTPHGPAALLAGYYFMVCLPTPRGGFSARPGEPVDEELAERRFLAYAWPAASGGPTQAYFIDEHENIKVSENLEAGAPRYAGQYFAPACDAALVESGEWQPWRGKKPRDELPGERR
jgi:hypothetical protein